MTDRTLPTEGSLASDATVKADPDSTSTPIRTPISIRASIPNQLGRYQVTGVLGRGGMGAVYAAEDPELGRRVAIKMLRDDLAADDRDALRREAQALARLEHPNVVAVYDVGVADDRVFLVMQLVDGTPIDAWARHSHASPGAVVAAFRDAGRGIAAAHDAGLVHCDIKPNNILVDRGGKVQVSDFGVAQIAADRATDHPTEPRRVAGTPAYMAPEQLQGSATRASDQFSFCVALWEVLAGERPFAEPAPDATTATAPPSAPRTPAPRLRAPRYVQRAVLRGLSSDPTARFPSMTALVDALAPPRWRRIAMVTGPATIAVAAIAVVAARTAQDAPPARPAPPGLGRADVAAVHHLTSFGANACAYAPTVGSDGTVVFDRTEGNVVDLYAVPIAGGVPRQLTSAATWEWRAHQGRRPNEVVHLVSDPGTATGEIAALDLVTGAETTLSHALANDAVAIGDTIYYTPIQAHEIRRIVGGRDEQAFQAPERQEFVALAASPAGDRLAAAGPVSAGVNRLCWIDVASARIDCMDHVASTRPTFGANGRLLYYFSDEGVRRHDVVSGSDELVMADLDAPGGLAMSPDGRALVASTCDARTELVDASTSPPSVLVSDARSARNPSVANDGSLAYLRVGRREADVMVRRADGTTVQVTGREVKLANSPALSPDGQHVAFAQGGSHPGLEIRAVDEPSYIVQLTESSRDTDPHWLDDETIMFTRRDERSAPSVLSVSARGGGPVTPVIAARSVRGSRGRQLLLASVDNVTWYDLDTKREWDLERGPDNVVYIVTSPSGRWIAYATGASRGDLWRLDLAAPHGNVEHVATLTQNATNEAIAITNDGRVIAAPMTWSGDLVVVPAAPGTRF